MANLVKCYRLNNNTEEDTHICVPSVYYRVKLQNVAFHLVSQNAVWTDLHQIWYIGFSLRIRSV